MAKDYNPTGVKEVGEPDIHGNKAYSVFFEGEDKPVFMKAKNAPSVGNIEYGQIIDAPKKSGDGTYRKFERKPREEGNTSSDVPVLPVDKEMMNTLNRIDRDDAITRQSALKSAVAAVGKPEPDQIISLADDFLKWLRNESTPAQLVGVPEKKEVKEKEPLPEFQGEDDIDLDAIQF